MNESHFRLELEDALEATNAFELLALNGVLTREASSAISSAYGQFLATHGRQLRHYQLNDQAKFRKFTKKSMDMLPFWMGDEEALDQPMLGVCASRVAGSGRWLPKSRFAVDVLPRHAVGGSGNSQP